MCPTCLGYQLGEKTSPRKTAFASHKRWTVQRERERERPPPPRRRRRRHRVLARREEEKHCDEKGREENYCVDAISFFKVGPDPTNFTGTFLRW